MIYRKEWRDDAYYDMDLEGNYYANGKRYTPGEFEQYLKARQNPAPVAPAPIATPPSYTTSNLVNYSAAVGIPSKGISVAPVAVSPAASPAASSTSPQSSPTNPNNPSQLTSPQMYALAAGIADPWAKNRGKYEGALNQLMTTGSSTEGVDPSYEARFKGGQQALERSQAAQGFLGSGNMAQALVDYGQSQASQEYSNQYNRLAALAGIDKSSPSQAGQIMALAPGQDLAEKNAAFGWNTQAMMLPYQAQAADIQNQMLQRQNTEGRQAFNKNQAALEEQVSDKQWISGVKQATGFTFGGYPLGESVSYAIPATEEQIAQRRRALGLD